MFWYIFPEESVLTENEKSRIEYQNKWINTIIASSTFNSKYFFNIRIYTCFAESSVSPWIRQFYTISIDNYNLQVNRKYDIFLKQFLFKIFHVVLNKAEGKYFTSITYFYLAST